MKKIRINELARELEVKPGVILEMLPVLGVQEKKTHSSSVDEDVALELRRRLTGSETSQRESANGDAEPEHAAGEEPESYSPPVAKAPPAVVNKTAGILSEPEGEGPHRVTEPARPALQTAPSLPVRPPVR